MWHTKQLAYHCHKPDSEYIWHRSWFAVRPHQPPEWLLPCGMKDTRHRHPSVARTRGDILCRTCDGTAETLAGGHGRQTGFDRSGTSACARSSQRLSPTWAELQRNASSAQIDINTHARHSRDGNPAV